MKILITGGSGFIGSNFVKHLLLNNHTVINLDYLTYASDESNLEDSEDHPNYRFIYGDIRNRDVVRRMVKVVDIVVHMAAESHVDNSIIEAGKFIDTNVFGTYVILDAVREYKKRLIHISTDEVYGDIPYPNLSKETDALQPSSPYSASKASGDHLVQSFCRTYGIDAVIVRPTNNYGPNQHKEKLIPSFVTKAYKNKRLPLYDGGTQVRDWLWVGDACEAIELLMTKGESGEIYNIGANQNPEITNMDLVTIMVDYLGKSKDLIMKSSRLGHDDRYGVDTSKIRDLGWKPKMSFEAGIKKTIEWYINGLA